MEIYAKLDELIKEIMREGHSVQRIMIGQDCSEIRVIYQVETPRVLKVRALIEGNEDSREHYDQLGSTCLSAFVQEIERDIAACYDT